MGLRAGLLTEKVTVQRPHVELNEYGEQTTVWSDHIRTKARVTYNSGSRNDAYNEIYNGYTVTMIMRVYHDVTTTDRIKYAGRLYRIDSLNIDHHIQQVTIIAQVINE